jgi:hypothetical protein
VVSVAKHDHDCIPDGKLQVGWLFRPEPYVSRPPEDDSNQVLDLTQESPNMSIEAHLAELERRHRALEAELAEARAHPSIDNLQVVELKMGCESLASQPCWTASSSKQ